MLTCFTALAAQRKKRSGNRENEPQVTETEINAV